MVSLIERDQAKLYERLYIRRPEEIGALGSLPGLFAFEQVKENPLLEPSNSGKLRFGRCHRGYAPNDPKLRDSGGLA
jgi:hypothetical protein